MEAAFSGLLQDPLLQHHFRQEKCTWEYGTGTEQGQGGQKLSIALPQYSSHLHLTILLSFVTAYILIIVQHSQRLTLS